MNRLLNQADEKLRTALLAPLPRVVYVLLDAVVLACFALLMMMKNLVQLSGAAMPARSMAMSTGSSAEAGIS